MKGICPFCEQERVLDHVTKPENINVRGELIEVESEFLTCLSCGNTFDDPQSEFDPLVPAYREYRKRHGLTQPEEIRQFRKRYGLTQSEFSAILGWGIATLNRYENGALQSEAHEKTLRLSMKPENFLRLIEETPSALNEEKRKRLTEELRKEEEEALSFERVIELHFGRYEPDEFSGYKKLELSKLFNTIVFFCKEPGVMKTKLNKLLFYADFRHFKEYAVSITGARYAHIPFGPAPDNYDYYF
ncbi:MAG: type II TA system antitoxin MqsA family protein, partial [Nitrospirota bacterium]